MTMRRRTISTITRVLSSLMLGIVASCVGWENPLAASLLVAGCVTQLVDQLLLWQDKSIDDVDAPASFDRSSTVNQINLAAGGMVISLLVEDWRLRVTGLGIIVCSSIGMMAAFWPTRENREPTPRSDTRFEIDENAVEAAPLLLDDQLRVVDEESATNYHLLNEHGEDDGPAENATVDAEIPQTPSQTEEVSLEGERQSNSRIQGTRRLLQLANPQLVYLYAGCLVLLVRLPCSLAMPHFVSTTLTSIAAQDFHEAHRQIVFLFMTGTIDAVLDFWGFFLFGFANQRIVKDLRVSLFRRLLGQEMAFFDQNSSGHLSSRLNSDCSEMAGDLTWFFRFSIESLVRITGITTYMMVRSYRLGLCALSIVPVVALINKLYGDWLSRNAATVQDALAEANATAQEALTNVRTVVAFCGEKQECNKYEHRIEVQYELNVKQLFLTALYYMVVSTFMINTVVQGTLLALGMRLIQHHGLSPGVLLAFMLYQSQLQNEVLSLMNSYTSLIKSSGAGAKVFALLDRIPPQPGTGADQPVNDHPVVECQSVVLENISFRYPSRPETSVLKDFNLTIPKGQTVALVGRSGCGKSTIVNLIQRFYDPIEGRVLIDGVDLKELDQLKHRGCIGVVTQEPSLISGTLWDNITYGCPDATEAQVRQAAERAHADTFIRRFPNGFQTTVGERGVQLSGGQKQRIAIARAIVKQPSMLLLDEATSALDAEAEEAVQAALDDLMKQQSLTVVVVAHRLRTVRNADTIVVLENGAVAESGPHEQLIRRQNGIYKSMVEKGTELLDET